MGVREARVRVRVHVRPRVAGQGTALTPEMDEEYLPEDETYDEDYFPDGEDYAAPGEQDMYPPPSGRPVPYATPGSLPATSAALRDALPEDASIEEVAVAALQTMLDHMGVRADVETEETPEDEPLKLNIVPDADYVLGTLIGRRGETLAALQLLVNLITYKQTGERERIIIDVEGYRARREDNLRSMAERIAQQVRSSGRPVMLEAMPPNERRIVHIALADYQDISTESTGEGDARRVVVSLRPTQHR
jgi:spoIIIJ-associated protein